VLLLKGFVVAILPDHESLNDIVEAVAFSVLFGFGSEFGFAFGRVVYHAGEDNGATGSEGSACPIAVEG